MQNNHSRPDGRTGHQARSVSLTFDYIGYADASVLYKMGSTQVLVSVTLQDGVPPFLRGKKTGWLTAEYAMLPTATQKRTNRESGSFKRNGRSVEISRLIGRCLRSCINLDALGERTIIIDADVLQADGGTRVAAISAASCALQIAQQRWRKNKSIISDLELRPIIGLSSGLVNGEVCVDLAQSEDMAAEADYNFVLTYSGELVEVQGTSEKQPISWDLFDSIRRATALEAEKLVGDITEQLSLNK